MQIALDVDGVLANVMPLWIELCNQRFRSNLTMSDATTWNFWRAAGISKADFFRVFSETWRNWRRIEPTESEIVRKVKLLESVGEVDIVTGRTPDTLSYVRCWLQARNIRYRRFVAVPSRISKASLPYSAYVDDAPNVVEAVARAGKWALLYDQPWNRDVAVGEKIIRVNGLLDAASKLEVVARTLGENEPEAAQSTNAGGT